MHNALLTAPDKPGPSNQRPNYAGDQLGRCTIRSSTTGKRDFSAENCMP